MGAVCASPKIKVACVGNSVTYGYGIPNRDKDSYPSQLGNLLGEGYEVMNFGHSGATLTHRSPMAYVGLPEFRQALSYKPDIAIIHLGLNDTDPRWWPNYGDEFIADYRALIDSFKVVNPKMRIWICLMTPITHEHSRFLSGTRDWHEQEQQAIRVVAEGAGVGLIDLFTPLFCHADLLPDALHPNETGAAIIAREVCGNITGDWGGLRMPITYGNHMVLQRQRPLIIAGSANAGEKVEVSLSGSATQRAVANSRGEWSIEMPAKEAGGPYTLTISTKKRKLVYHDVWMGDVWLCSGQSNMEFPLAQCATASQDLTEVVNMTRLHILNFSPIALTHNMQWSQAVLDSVNALQYLTTRGWQLADRADMGGVSAVAYHFAKTLMDSIADVHIAIICNAVGGSALESWVDHWTLQYQYPQILNNWLQNDHIQRWVRERAATNIGLSPNKRQRHPYEPCYMYECGILPLKHTALKGTIWYQGESNAHNTELHERLFPLLLESWRNSFDDKTIPFYFVQLSSLNRPSWPKFRNSQRLLAERLPNVWMAVSSDVGDSLDVHPIRKQEVGYRLALQALCHSYGHTLTSQGPTPAGVDIRGGEIVVDFRFANGMRPASGNELLGFEVAGSDGLYYPAKAKIEGAQVRVSAGEKVAHPCHVRYGWQPFTRANLVNASGLPASTFKF